MTRSSVLRRTLSRRSFLKGTALAASSLRARGAWADDVAAAEAAARRGLVELQAFAERENARISACVRDVVSGRELGSILSHAALNPASNQKILTMLAALERMGPAHRFTTTLAGRGSGTLSELVLRSDGDPELDTERLSELVELLVARGVRRIEGDLFVDQSAFDSVWDPPAYEQRPNDWSAYRAPVSAVAVDRNAIALHVLAETAGKAARVWFQPPGLVEIRGGVQTGRPNSAQSVRLTVRPHGDRLEALVGGSAPAARRELTFTRRIADPELAPGHVLLSLLQGRSIVVSGRVRAGGSGAKDEIASVQSRPLAKILPALGKQSDNFSAEMLLKALGRTASGVPGTSAAGATVIEALLRRKNAFDPGTRILNGSGLYDANRISADALVRVLIASYFDLRLGSELVSSLAIGGIDGTLARRFASQAARRNIRAKSGSLADVVALSGYVFRVPPKGPIVFSVIANQVAGKHEEVRKRIDALVEGLANA